MISIILTFLGLAIILSACVWAINKIVPEPFRTWAIVIIVVLAACCIGAMLMGAAPFPGVNMGLHR